MCKQKTLVIILGVAIFIMVATMLYLLYASTSTEKHGRSSGLTYSQKFCSAARQKCLNDSGCRVPLNYLETFCRYTDHLSPCSKKCQTMVTCLTLNKAAVGIPECKCDRHTSAVARAEQITSDGGSTTSLQSSESASWCFPFDASWCPPDQSRANKEQCAKLDSCSPFKHLCSGNLTIVGCEHVDLRGISDECNQLFDHNRCSDLCRMLTKLAWNRTKMKTLHDCICEKYPTPCDLEKSIIINHCLAGKRTI